MKRYPDSLYKTHGE